MEGHIEMVLKNQDSDKFTPEQIAQAYDMKIAIKKMRQYRLRGAIKNEMKKPDADKTKLGEQLTKMDNEINAIQDERENGRTLEDGTKVESKAKGLPNSLEAVAKELKVNMDHDGGILMAVREKIIEEYQSGNIQDRAKFANAMAEKYGKDIQTGMNDVYRAALGEKTKTEKRMDFVKQGGALTAILMIALVLRASSSEKGQGGGGYGGH